jgi:hypothetical protein
LQTDVDAVQLHPLPVRLPVGPVVKVELPQRAAYVDAVLPQRESKGVHARALSRALRQSREVISLAESCLDEGTMYGTTSRAAYHNLVDAWHAHGLLESRLGPKCIIDLGCGLGRPLWAFADAILDLCADDSQFLSEFTFVGVDCVTERLDAARLVQNQLRTDSSAFADRFFFLQCGNLFGKEAVLELVHTVLPQHDLRPTHMYSYLGKLSSASGHFVMGRRDYNEPLLMFRMMVLCPSVYAVATHGKGLGGLLAPPTRYFDESIHESEDDVCVGEQWVTVANGINARENLRMFLHFRPGALQFDSGDDQSLTQGRISIPFNLIHLTLCVQQLPSTSRPATTTGLTQSVGQWQTQSLSGWGPVRASAASNQIASIM